MQELIAHYVPPSITLSYLVLSSGSARKSWWALHCDNAAGIRFSFLRQPCVWMLFQFILSVISHFPLTSLEVLLILCDCQLLNNSLGIFSPSTWSSWLKTNTVIGVWLRKPANWNRLATQTQNLLDWCLDGFSNLAHSGKKWSFPFPLTPLPSSLILSCWWICGGQDLMA